MSAGWEIGDLAVCVDARDMRPGLPSRLVDGATYTVAGVAYADCPHFGVDYGLHLREVESSTTDGWWAQRFRKVVSDKQEPCEEEFVTLLKRSKVSA